MNDHGSFVHDLSSCEIKGLNGIRTDDFSDAGAGLYQLSHQAKRELVTL